MDLAISGGVNHTDDLRVNRTWRFGGVNRTDDLRVNWTWQFEGKSDLAISVGGGKSCRRFEGKSDLAIFGGWREGGKSYR